MIWIDTIHRVIHILWIKIGKAQDPDGYCAFIFIAGEVPVQSGVRHCPS